MTRSRNTKKSLVFSALSMLLCCAMLAGSTFAWFTDSVTTAKNQIVAGNLDVELEYWNGTEYVNAADATLFDATLWEPGVAQVVYLKINNAGSLALKYKFAVNVLGETEGTNAAGEAFKLSDYLMFGVAEDQDTVFADRAAAVAAVEANAAALAAYSKDGSLEAGSDAEYVALVIYMPETVGNDANYKTGTTAPTIDLSVTLVATQDTVEADGFDNQYDAGAVYPAMSIAELKTALSNGGNVIVGKSVAITEDTADARTKVSGTTTLDLNDNSIMVEGPAKDTNWMALFVTGDLTINGNGTVGSTEEAQAYAVHVAGEKLTINGGNYIGTTTCINVQKGIVIINDGFFSATPYNGSHKFTLNCVDANYKNGTADIIVYGGTFVNFDPSNNAAEGAGTNFVADGYTVVSEQQANGDIWYTVVAQ